MSKTFDEYMNDPRIKDEMMGLRMTHAMRFKVQDDIEGMTPEERTAYYREGTRAAFARLGITPKYASPHHDNA